jgi:hypothetical protein
MTTATFINLKPDTNYNIEIIPMNDSGAGTSEIINVKSNAIPPRDTSADPLTIIAKIKRVLEGSSVTNISEDLSAFKRKLDGVSEILQKLDFSISIPVTDTTITTLLYAYYDIINPDINSGINMNVITTKLDEDKNQLMEISKITNIVQGLGVNLIIPLDAGALIKIKDVDGTIIEIKRGTLTDSTGSNQTKQINVNNSGWKDYDEIIKLKNYQFKFLASGSPIVINASIPRPKPILAPPSISITSSSENDNTMMYIICGIVIFSVIGVVVYMSIGNSKNIIINTTTGKKGGYFEDGE